MKLKRPYMKEQRKHSIDVVSTYYFDVLLYDIANNCDQHPMLYFDKTYINFLMKCNGCTKKLYKYNWKRNLINM